MPPPSVGGFARRLSVGSRDENHTTFDPLTQLEQLVYTIGMSAKTDVVLTPQMIQKIIDAVEQVSAARFGEVVIVVERGVPRWVRPAPSIELSEPPQEQGDKR